MPLLLFPYFSILVLHSITSNITFLIYYKILIVFLVQCFITANCRNETFMNVLFTLILNNHSSIGEINLLIIIKTSFGTISLHYFSTCLLETYLKSECNMFKEKPEKLIRMIGINLNGTSALSPILPLL